MRAVYHVTGVLFRITCVLSSVCMLFLAGILILPKLFGCEPYIVLSGSMEPMIHVGSLVYVGHDKDLEVGDVAAYLAGDGAAVIHRMMGYSDSEGYTFKGDANETVDLSAVYPGQIIGKYAADLPKMGYVISYLERHALRIGPLSIPAVIPMLLDIIVLFFGLHAAAGVLLDDTSDET